MRWQDLEFLCRNQFRAELEDLNLEDGDDSWRTIKQVTSENSGSMTQGRMLLHDYDSVSTIVMNSRGPLGLHILGT